MASIEYNSGDKLSLSYPAPIVMNGETYNSVLEWINSLSNITEDDILSGLRVKYNTHIDLRLDLVKTQGYELIGDYEYELSKIRDEILEHDELRDEKIDINQTQYCVLGNFNIKLPSIENLYLVRREVFCLNNISVDKSSLPHISVCKQFERTFSQNIYISFIVNDIQFYYSNLSLFAVPSPKSSATDKQIFSLIRSFLNQ